MQKNPIQIDVYGMDQICASCVNAPSSIDTYEWLQAAISRKYPEQAFSFRYIDVGQILNHTNEFAQKIVAEELFYPLIVINDEVVAEGYVQLKAITKKIEAILF